MNHSPISPTVIPGGNYYLGDPCYSVPDSEWDDLLSTCDYFERPVGTLRDGTKVYALGTTWGDGEYTGSNGFSYGVDSGLIGLVPVTVAVDDDFLPSLVTVVEFTQDTVMDAHRGILVFGHISINTDDCDSGDEDDGFGDEGWGDED